MSESKHPLTEWMERQVPPLKPVDAAAKLGCSEAYLSLVINGHRGVSLKRAIKWSRITGIPTDHFDAEEAAAAKIEEAAAP